MDHRRHPGVRGHLHGVREREEGVRGHHRPLRPIARFADGDPGGVHPGHLPGADPHRGEVPREDDGVRLHPHRHRPGEQQVAPLALGRLPGRDDLHVLASLHDPVAVLHERPTRQRPDVEPVTGRQRRPDHPEALARPEGRERVVGEPGSHDDLGEDVRHRPGGGLVGLPVEGHDPAEGRDGVGLVGPEVGVGQGPPEGGSARVVVLDDHRGRLLERRRERVGGLQVEPVVEGHLLAGHEHLGPAEDAGPSGLRVEGSALVGVLAVPEVLDLAVREPHERRQPLPRGEPSRHGGVVRGRVGEGLRGELAPELEREPPVPVDRLQDLAVAGGVHDDPHGGEVLRRRPHHRRTPDVDLLDHLLGSGAARDGLPERVEVHDDEIEGLDTLLRELPLVLRVPPIGEDAGVDPRVEGLHPPAEHLREPGDLLDRRHGHARLAERRGRPPRGDERGPPRHEAPGELHRPRLVVHRQQRPADRTDLAHPPSRRSSSSSSTWTMRPSTLSRPSIRARTARGKIRCSTSWIRASSESRSSPS
ncbi:hypothetical protein HRbin12_01247 [bacterium HR12]|nr:hypothetical protein HRbin12_01247 [bacterium HR12]